MSDAASSIIFVIIIGLFGVGLFYFSHMDNIQTNQCKTVCYPYVVMTNEETHCICANSPNVIWRKDIK